MDIKTKVKQHQIKEILARREYLVAKANKVSDKTIKRLYQNWNQLNILYTLWKKALIISKTNKQKRLAHDKTQF